MSLINKLNQIKRLNDLIRRKGTGRPKELACRLNVSERCIYRIIDEMRLMGFPIEFCRSRNSYIYSSDIEVNIAFEVKEKECH